MRQVTQKIIDRLGPLAVVLVLVGLLAVVVIGRACWRTYVSGKTLYEASEAGSCGVVRFILAVGGRKTYRTTEGASSIHAAAEAGAVDCVKVLLDRGFDPNDRDKYSYTPLHAAANYGHVECAKVLLAHGADLHATTRDQRISFDGKPGTLDGFTTLHFAANNGHVEMIKYLVSQGAEVDAQTSRGFTPLMEAILGGPNIRGHVDAVRALLEAGANPWLRGPQGTLPITAIDGSVLRKEMQNVLRDAMERTKDRAADR